MSVVITRSCSMGEKFLNKTHLSEAYTDAYGRALKNLFNFMAFKENEHFNDITIERWRKAIKIRKSGVREVYVKQS